MHHSGMKAIDYWLERFVLNATRFVPRCVSRTKRVFSISESDDWIRPKIKPTEIWQELNAETTTMAVGSCESPHGRLDNWSFEVEPTSSTSPKSLDHEATNECMTRRVILTHTNPLTCFTFHPLSGLKHPTASSFSQAHFLHIRIHHLPALSSSASGQPKSWKQGRVPHASFQLLPLLLAKDFIPLQLKPRSQNTFRHDYPSFTWSRHICEHPFDFEDRCLRLLTR